MSERYSQRHGRPLLWASVALGALLLTQTPVQATSTQATSTQAPSPQAEQTADPSNAAPALSAMPAVMPAIQVALMASPSIDPGIINFYQQRGWQPIWFTNAPDQADRIANLRQAFIEVSRHGLRPPRLGESWDQLPEADKDIRLTQEAARLARVLADGELRPLDTRIAAVPRPAAVENLLLPLSVSPMPGDALLSLAPQTVPYRALLAALEKVRQDALHAPWPKVPSSGKLSPGDNAPEVLALRQRLAASGDYQADETMMASTIYDEELEKAVRAFQERHSLDVDGIVGVGTREALNISVAERVDIIKINLDRLRRLPEILGPRHLLVNVAGFEAWLYEGDNVLFDTPIIVGKDTNQTPTFSNIIRSVEFNPSWEVPRSIGLKEILPALAKDPTYLESHNMDVFEGWENGGTPVDPSTVDWVALAKTGTLPYRFRQRPGTGNSLGRVKLLFPNEHDVYLHDTPSRGLFRRGQRAFSHGCMRVGKPLELASVVLGLDQKRIDRVVASGEKTRLLVRNPLPIHITYLTAWVDPKTGDLRYASDIYGRDLQMMAQLHQFDDAEDDASGLPSERTAALSE